MKDEAGPEASADVDEGLYAAQVAHYLESLLRRDGCACEICIFDQVSEIIVPHRDGRLEGVVTITARRVAG